MTRTMKVLLVEDNEQVAHFVCKGLQEAGNSVDHAGDGAAGVALAGAGHYDAVIMDRMLPGAIDGLGVIAALRRAGNDVPILILSSVAGVDERIRGLNGGADDYLVKPFDFGELLARLRALARRPPATAASMLAVGDLTLDLATHRVRRGADGVSLSVKEVQILEVFMRHPDQVLTRTQILEGAWDSGYEYRSNVIDVYVRYLRQKIDRPFGRTSLETVRGLGYRLRSA